MNNKKINKGIFTGLAAITLFAPMMLHNTQVNADNSNVQAKDSIQASELQSVFHSSKQIESIHFNKNVDSTNDNKQDITTNNIKDGSSYNPHDIDQVSLKDRTTLTLPSSQINNKKELAKAINTRVKNHANASEIKPLLGKYHIKSIHTTEDDKNITSETPNNTRYNLNDIDYVTFGNDTKMNLSSNHQYYRLVDLDKDINTQIHNKKQINANAQAKDSIQASELQSVFHSSKQIESIHFNKNVDSTNDNKQDITTNNIKDGSSYNPHDIDQVSFSNHQGDFKLNGANSVDDLNQKISKLYNQMSNNDKNTSNIPVTPSGNINSSSNNSNANNNSHYTKPQMNDGSKEASFPTAPKVSTNKNAKHSKKVTSKQLKKNKASVKKNQKHLKAVKRALRKAKGKARKAKLNKQLRKAKKAFAKSEKKLNHAIHNAK